MIVTSEVLTAAAETIRKRKSGAQRLSAGVDVTAAQLDTCARLLREAEPSVITGGRNLPPGTRIGVAEERPGFIDAEKQEDATVLVFQVGILPSVLHRIDRQGRCVE